MCGRLIEDPVFRYRLRLSREGEVLRGELWVEPGGGTIERLHPPVEERFEVLDGELTYRADGSEHNAPRTIRQSRLRSATVKLKATPTKRQTPRRSSRRPRPSFCSERGDMTQPSFAITTIGTVESPLTDPASAPNQGDEGAPDAWLAFEPAAHEALDGIRPGDEVIVLTWLHHARRDVLRVHPRGDVSRPRQGVFSTRSPHRPNPIGLHRVHVASIDGARVRVHNLEAVHGTPIIDVKPVLSSDITER